MANYYGTGRTNWFKVKDADAFKAEMEKFSVEVGEGKGYGEEDGLFALFGLSEEGMPWQYYDEEADDYVDIEWDKVLGKHLADDWVCVLQEVGNEKMRYVNGFAMAFNNRGDVETLNLSKIYDLAKDFGKNINVI